MTDIKRIQSKLQKAAQDVKADSVNKVQEVGHLGFNFALNMAPQYTGALKAAMRLELSTNVARIISSHPSGDIPPVHIAFDTGDFSMLKIKKGNQFVPFVPRLASSVGYMRQTALWLRVEFSRRLRMAITRSIEKVGSVK